MLIGTMEKTGKAYAFFYYAGKREDVEGELPRAMTAAQTPLEMKLSVTRTNALDTSRDSALADITERARSARMNYVLEGTMPDSNNRSAANKVNNVMAGIYNGLYSKKEPISAVIVYKRGEKYVFKRD